MYKRGHGVMEATSLYIHTCMGSSFPNIHAMRYDGWFFVVVIAFLSFAKREIFSRKQVSIGIVPVYNYKGYYIAMWSYKIFLRVRDNISQVSTVNNKI